MTTVIHSFPVWLPQTQTWMYNQVRFLPAEIECHVVCERTENMDQFGVPNIHSLADRPILRRIWAKASRKLLRRHHPGLLSDWLRKSRAGLLHSHFAPVGWWNIPAGRRTGVSHLVTFYGYDVNSLPATDVRWRTRYSELFGAVDCVLCEGPYMAQSIIDLGCPRELIRIHHLGVVVDEIAFVPRTWEPSEPLRVLIAASFREKKGIPYALEALGRFQLRVPLEVTIIGDTDGSDASSKEKERILQALTKHDLGDRVRLLGFQKHGVLFDEAYKHHVFLSPSLTARDGDSEGGAPVTIIEMAATGMPVISTRHCDIPEVIEHEAAGFLAEERDVDGLVSCLERLVERPDRWHAMVTTARRHIEREFDAARQGRKLAQIYTEISA